ncbi:MAG: hypothetical protein ACHQXA_10140 [Gemmatimonadales bacterium]
MRHAILGALLLATACGGTAATGKTAADSAKKKADTMTTRQKDSALSTTTIPGAHAIGAAMHAADSTSAHITALDTVGQN